jgi:hypothetical protein
MVKLINDIMEVEMKQQTDLMINTENVENDYWVIKRLPVL